MRELTIVKNKGYFLYDLEFKNTHIFLSSCGIMELLLQKIFHDKRMLCKNDSFEEKIISNVFGILYNALK